MKMSLEFSLQAGFQFRQVELIFQMSMNQGSVLELAVLLPSRSIPSCLSNVERKMPQVAEVEASGLGETRA